jgi:hypothetical protein
MKTFGLFAIVLITSFSLSAQSKPGFVNSGNITRTAPSVLYPAGTSGPGVQRTAGSVLYPGGGGPQIGIPSSPVNPNFPGTHSQSRTRSSGYIYSYPVYVGGSYYDGYYGQQPAPPVQEQQPNVTVIYPPAAPPVIINQYGTDGSVVTRVQPQNIYPMQQPRQRTEEAAAPAAETSHYLIAFKDHSIYSAVAYWVDGDTLHYFTTGSTHNQASVSLVDREMTDRLNKDSGVEVKLPAAK